MRLTHDCLSGSSATYQPLRGVTVISLEQAVAGPLATRHLADLGARVIKVERPGDGDLARGYDRTVKGVSSHFVWLNRGKESIVLDLKDDDDLGLLKELIARADVVVQNLAPGAVARLGLDAAVLRGDRPDLIVCDISGYGSGGPYSDRKAYDLLIQCEAGLVSITGTEDAPSKVGISIADIATGMYAFSGMLAAIIERQRTGLGASLEVSMLEALGEWMGYPYYYSVYGGTPPARSGASHATIAPYGPFTAGDGVTLNLGLQAAREWEAFCRDFLLRPELVADARFVTNADRVANRVELDRLIADFIGRFTSAEITERLDIARIAWAQQRDVADFANHPQLHSRQRFQTIQTPGGPVEALLPPVTVAGAAPPMGDVPDLDEHGDRIREWLAAGSADRSGPEQARKE